MASETTCPTCGGPCIESDEPVNYLGQLLEPGFPAFAHTRVRHTTAADPAQVQAMRELLREIGLGLHEAKLAGEYARIGLDRWLDRQARIAKILEGVP